MSFYRQDGGRFKVRLWLQVGYAAGKLVAGSWNSRVGVWFAAIGQTQGRSSIYRLFLEFNEVTYFWANARAGFSVPVQELGLSAVRPSGLLSSLSRDTWQLDNSGPPPLTSQFLELVRMSHCVNQIDFQYNNNIINWRFITIQLSKCVNDWMRAKERIIMFLGPKYKVIPLCCVLWSFGFNHASRCECVSRVAATLILRIYA